MVLVFCNGRGILKINRAGTSSLKVSIPRGIQQTILLEILAWLGTHFCSYSSYIATYCSNIRYVNVNGA